MELTERVSSDLGCLPVAVVVGCNVSFPHRYGARHCVLVGDPRQLPATVISTLATECRYDRSLLERLTNVGVGAIQLNEQFRMHPQIRQFPSKYVISTLFSHLPLSPLSLALFR